MARWRVLIFILIVLAAGGVLFLSLPRDEKRQESTSGTPVDKEESSMIIQSTAFSHNQKIPVKYACDGEDISPPLTISGVPGEAKSLVLIVDDPDAPAGTWVHWLVWDIDAGTQEISEGSVPPGAIEGMTSFGKPGYGGPCPPSGEHRYFFTLWALDSTLGLNGQAKKSNLMEAIKGHILTEARLIGTYSR